MKAIFNDVETKSLSVIDVKPSKREYCHVLGCDFCRMDIRSIEGHRFGLVQDAEYHSDYISGNNVYDNPELTGSFILLGLSYGRLRGLTDDEEKYFMGYFGRWHDGRYVLCDID